MPRQSGRGTAGLGSPLRNIPELIVCKTLLHTAHRSGCCYTVTVQYFTLAGYNKEVLPNRASIVRRGRPSLSAVVLLRQSVRPSRSRKATKMYSFPFGPAGLSMTSVSTTVSMGTVSMGTVSMGQTSTGCAMGASGLTACGFSASAPVWLQSCKGLNVEGICCNENCVANGKLVIYPAGFTCLDLVNPQGRCTCPCCKSCITPVTAAFSGCEWTMSGIKTAYPGAQLESVDATEWHVASPDKYERFTDDPTDQTRWTRLCITAREPSNKVSSVPSIQPPTSGSNQVVCSICVGEPFSRFGPTAINTPCGHCYHRACLKPWVQMSRVDCPTCCRDISCLAPELLRM